MRQALLAMRRANEVQAPEPGLAILYRFFCSYRKDAGAVAGQLGGNRDGLGAEASLVAGSAALVRIPPATG